MNAVSEALSKRIAAELSEHLSRTMTPLSWTPVGGGCINESFRIGAGPDYFFVKINKAGLYPDMFETEALGLDLLREAEALPVPGVIAYGEEAGFAFLLLEYVGSSDKPVDFWAQTGRGLARLHQKSAAEFGLEYDNYIGSLKQHNHQEESWSAFLINQRLLVQLGMCADRGHADAGMIRMFERLFPKLEDYFPPEPPALIHGDLWSGNYLCGAAGKAHLIDPAVYFGHREMDLAMSLLFGGFGPEMYSAYHEVYPLESGWRERIDLCNLYPLLVHTNLFGGSYSAQVRTILKRFC